ncbi:MAG: 4a-hydroxytetrahydrobiopterin dehydratase, partial [Myxococcota bacterium]
GVDKLGPDQVDHYLSMVEGWQAKDDKIKKTFELKDFVTALQFINHMGAAAEEQGHHPDFCVHYNKIEVTIWTHAIGGLSENDFILAAIIDDLKV